MKAFYGLITYIFLSISLISCDVSEDEIWREKAELKDGSYIFIYHSNDCTFKRPLIPNKEKKIDFQKLKYNVYSSCIDEEEAKVLNAISYKNIQKYKGALYYSVIEEDLTYYWERFNLLDESNRTYCIGFSMKNDSLVEIDPPINFQD